MSSYILRKIDPALWRQVKAKAASEGVTIDALLRRLLADWLKGDVEQPARDEQS